MTIFDLLFILLFLAGCFGLVVAAWYAVQGRFDRTGRTMLRLLLCATVYMAIVIVTSMILTRRSLKAGELQCFDDYCVSIAGYRRTAQGDGAGYTVDVGLLSRARRVSQRENNLVLYLTDDRGRRFDPLPDPAATPFNVLLGPGESATVGRSFAVPGDARGVGAVLSHEGGFPIGWLIIGYNTWFRKPPVIALT